VLTIGVGGVLTEVIADAAVRVLPVDDADIRAMIGQTRVGTLLAGVRGAPPADVDALVATVRGLLEATAGWSDGFELDLNPVKVLTEGCWILDAAFTRSVSTRSLEPHTEGHH
jgi:hypothetical protein